MIKIKHAQGSQVLSVSNGAYNQIYKHLGWTPVAPPEQVVEPASKKPVKKVAK